MQALSLLERPSRILTCACNVNEDLLISFATKETLLFSIVIKEYSSPFLLDGGVKFLYVDRLDWRTDKAKKESYENTTRHCWRTTPIVLMEEGEDEIQEDEIEDLYEIVRWGKRSWPMGQAKVWIKHWLDCNQTRIGVDYFQ